VAKQQSNSKSLAEHMPGRAHKDVGP